MVYSGVQAGKRDQIGTSSDLTIDRQTEVQVLSCAFAARNIFSDFLEFRVENFFWDLGAWGLGLDNIWPEQIRLKGSDTI